MQSRILKHFKKNDPVLYKYLINIRETGPKKSDNYFASFCEIIINQQLSDKAGTTIFNRITKLFPDKKITPENLLKIPDKKIRTAGSSLKKIEYMKIIAKMIITKELDIDKLIDKDNKTVIDILTKIKGIGPWTAEMFLMFALGREDVFSSGDLGLKKAIKKIYRFNKNPTQEEMIKISQKWIPYRTYACLALWRSQG